jgi:hypothetical protein
MSLEGDVARELDAELSERLSHQGLSHAGREVLLGLGTGAL